MKATQKKVFWLTDYMTSDLRAKAMLLAANGFHVHFFTKTDALAAELQTDRASVVVLSDNGDLMITERMIFTLMGMPEVNGARLILACSNPDTQSKGYKRLQFLCACASFRDFIPMDLDADRWMRRFRFATAGHALKVKPPTGQLTTHDMAAVHLPARITWITPGSIRIESKAHPAPGTTLTVSGAIADALGVPNLSLKVQDTERDYLTYRFSEAIICDWQIPSHACPRLQELFAKLEEQNTGPRARVFIAASDPQIRNQLLYHFENPRFEVTSALLKSSIVSEPKFFSPDLVIIEHVLCVGPERNRFEQMLDSLSDQTHVVILGIDPEIEEIKNRYPLKRITRLGKLPRNFEQSVIRRYLPEYKRDSRAPKDALYIPSDSSFSLAELTISARVKQIHPGHVQIASPVRLGNYALLRLDMPALKKHLRRAPYIKLTETYMSSHPHANAFVNIAQATFTDLNKSERKKMADALANMAAEALLPKLKAS